jgi:membrane dipeptidase
MISVLAERDGVIGVVPFIPFIKQGWKLENGRDKVTIQHLIDMIDHICQVTSSARHVGLGTDWDGGFGREALPLPFDTVTDLWLMKDALAQRGYQEDDVRAILSGNFLRMLSQCLP